MRLDRVAAVALVVASASSACVLFEGFSDLEGSGSTDAAIPFETSVVGDAGADGEANDAACVGAPPDPTLLSDVISIAGGNSFACALRGDHSVVCWGTYYRGQLGFPPDGGDQQMQSTVIAQSVVGLPSTIQSISAGDSDICAIDDAQHVWSWGSNVGGALGRGEVIATDGGGLGTSPAPGLVQSASGPLEQVTAVGVGLFAACAILQGGLVTCWGNDQSDQLGFGPDSGLTHTRASLSTVAGGGGATNLSLGAGYTCAVVGTSVRCVGSNSEHQLGATPSDAGVAVTMPLPSSAKTPAAVSASFYLHPVTLVLDSAGNVFGTGDNSQGALGSFASDVPVAIPGLNGGNVVQVATGPLHVCALLSDTSVMCLGGNGAGELGRGFTSPSEPNPAFVIAAASPDAGVSDAGDGTKLVGVSQVVVGYGDTCALVKNPCRTDGTVYCWGLNYTGEVGDGTSVGRARPSAVLAPSK